MISNAKELIKACQEVLAFREYRLEYRCVLEKEWTSLEHWMNERGILQFSRDVGFTYADQLLGGHLINESFPKANRVKLRAIRMLISYQEQGDFEYRTPSVERSFIGPFGDHAKEYFCYLMYVQKRSSKTLESKELYLTDFCRYTGQRNLAIDSVTTELLEDFFSVMNYSLSSRHCCSTCLRGFFRYCYDHSYTQKDNSIFILADNYRKDRNLPTTYTEDEITRVIDSIERSSAIGKRDYLIVLLAAEYGWRASDITGFRLDMIDWDKNAISFSQKKTNVPVEFPLLASVGNAIIDYLKYARPQTENPEIIVSHAHESKGKPLTSPTVHSVVAKYMKKANIEAWQQKKHGPHSLRHSLATNMLAHNVSLPVISTVLGHQSTETTKVYLKVDLEKLKECTLPMPPVSSTYYPEVTT